MDGTSTRVRYSGGAGSQGCLVCGYVWMGSKKAMFGLVDDLFIYLFSTLKSHYHDYRDMDGWNTC